MPLPRIEQIKANRSERARVREAERRKQYQTHYLFLPGGAPLKGTLDLFDRQGFSVRGIPRARLVPLVNQNYQVAEICHPDKAETLLLNGPPQDEDYDGLMDAVKTARDQAMELFESYGNPIFGINLIIVESLTGVGLGATDLIKVDVAEEIEPLLLIEIEPGVMPRDLIEIRDCLEGAPERIRAAECSNQVRELASAAGAEMLQAVYDRIDAARTHCETSINEVASAKAGHEGKKALDGNDAYWFKQLQRKPPAEDLGTPLSVPTKAETEAEGRVECPDCAEYIKAQAKVCRFCGARFGRAVSEILSGEPAIVKKAALPADEDDEVEPVVMSGFGEAAEEIAPAVVRRPQPPQLKEAQEKAKAAREAAKAEKEEPVKES